MDNRDTSYFLTELRIDGLTAKNTWAKGGEASPLAFRVYSGIPDSSKVIPEMPNEESKKRFDYVLEDAR